MTYTTIAAIFFTFWLSTADTTQAEALINAGHLKRARVILEAFQRSNPKDARTLYLLSRVREGFGDLDAALQLAEQALALDSKNADYHYWVAAMSGETAEKSSMFKQLSLARRTRKEAEIAISLDPKHVDARSVLVSFYLEAPAFIGGDRQKAREMAAEIARIDPVEGASVRAEIARAENDTTALEAAYLSGAAVVPQDYTSQMELAKYYASDAKRNYEGAEKFARVAMKIDPGQAGAYGLLAVLFAQKPRISELDALLAQSEKSVSDNLDPFYQAGHVFLTQGKELPRAESYFRKYLTQEPEAGAPDLAQCHWQLGLVLEKLGRKPEAITELEQAVQLRPDFADARKDLKRLKSRA